LRQASSDEEPGFHGKFGVRQATEFEMRSSLSIVIDINHRPAASDNSNVIAPLLPDQSTA